MLLRNIRQRKSTRKINGWLYKVDIEIFKVIADTQRKIGIEGSLGEIGVHHGKSFLTLHEFFKPEKCLVIDVFEQQKKNIDKSGNGDYQILIDNMKEFSVPLENIEIVKKSSLDVSANEILTKVPRFAIAHVDGAHYFEAVMSDIRLFAKCLCDGGVLIIDDYARGEWPDVSAAIWQVYYSGEYNLEIIAFGQNKIFITDREFSGDYIEALYSDLRTIDLITKSHFMSGQKIPVFQLFPSERWSGLRWLHYICHLYNPFFARLLRRARKRLFSDASKNKKH